MKQKQLISLKTGTKISWHIKMNKKIIMVTSLLVKQIIISLLVILSVSCQKYKVQETEIKVTDKFSIYPRPRNTIVIGDSIFGFYNYGFQNFLFFSAENGNPVKNIEMEDLPLEEMYEIIINRHDSIVINSFESYSVEEKDQFRRKFSAHGLHKSESGSIYSIVKIPYRYVGDFFYDGEIVQAIISRSEHFLVFFDTNLKPSEYFLIEQTALPDRTALYFPVDLLMYKDDNMLIAPIIKRTSDQNPKSNDYPGYAILHRNSDKFFVNEIKYFSNPDYCRVLSGHSIYLSFYHSSKNSHEVYFATGNEIRVLNLDTGALGDEIVFKDDKCKRISHIKYSGDKFYYACGDFVFNEKPDYNILIKNSKGENVTEINPIITVFPFYGKNELFYIETSIDFEDVVLKRVELK